MTKGEFRSFDFVDGAGESFEDRDQFLRAAGLAKYRYMPAIGKNLSVEDDGVLNISNGKKESFIPTKRGFEKFCTKLGIPDPFAKKIPKDLLLHNIHRLLETEDMRVEPFIFVLRDSDEAVINVSKVVDQIRPGTVYNRLLEADRFEFVRGYVGDDGTKVAVRDTSVEDIVIGADDVSWGGMILTTSETGRLPLRSRFNIYRTSCENSAILPAQFFAVLGRRKKGVASEDLVNTFVADVLVSSAEFGKLREIYEDLPNCMLTEGIFGALWNTVKTTTNSEVYADEILKIEEVERKELKVRVSERKRGVTALFDPEPDPEYSMSFYDAMNCVTFAARDEKYGLGFEQTLKLENLGGKLVMLALQGVK